MVAIVYIVMVSRKWKEKERRIREWEIRGCQKREGTENEMVSPRASLPQIPPGPQEFTHLNVISHTVPNSNVVSLMWFCRAYC